MCNASGVLEICFSQLELALPSWDPTWGFLLQLHWDTNGICKGWTARQLYSYPGAETWAEAGIRMSERLPGI